MRALLLVGAVMFSWAGQAKAAPISATYDFVGTFNTGPNAQITGSIGLSYDSSFTGSVTVNSFVSDALAQYVPVMAASDESGLITFGNRQSFGDFIVVPGTNSFFATFSANNSGDVTSSGSFLYAASGTSGVFSPTSFVVTREVAAVPEPASLALLAAGLVGAGVIRRRRSA